MRDAQDIEVSRQAVTDHVVVQKTRHNRCLDGCQGTIFHLGGKAHGGGGRFQGLKDFGLRDVGCPGRITQYFSVQESILRDLRHLLCDCAAGLITI